MSRRMLGFIGLSVMGYPLAVNLLKNLDACSRLQVYAVTSRVLDKLKDEDSDLLSASSSAREVADRVVRVLLSI